ncbi:hypothetical protein BC826DRAFT_182730 [Russula brevipes]|nr:hypothetical protein BC826DRAFT_182730 [Russula brevipes]
MMSKSKKLKLLLLLETFHQPMSHPLRKMLNLSCPTLFELPPLPARTSFERPLRSTYRSASSVSESEVAVAELRNVTPSDAVSSTLEHDNSEAVLAFDDFSDSTATITPGSAAPPATSPLSVSNATAPASPETFLRSVSHDILTFPKSASHASTDSGEAHEDAVLDDPSEGGSVGSTADGWSEVDA